MEILQSILYGLNVQRGRSDDVLIDRERIPGFIQLWTGTKESLTRNNICYCDRKRSSALKVGRSESNRLSINLPQECVYYRGRVFPSGIKSSYTPMKFLFPYGLPYDKKHSWKEKVSFHFNAFGWIICWDKSNTLEFKPNHPCAGMFSLYLVRAQI